MGRKNKTVFHVIWFFKVWVPCPGCTTRNTRTEKLPADADSLTAHGIAIGLTKIRSLAKQTTPGVKIPLPNRTIYHAGKRLMSMGLFILFIRFMGFIRFMRLRRLRQSRRSRLLSGMWVGGCTSDHVLRRQPKDLPLCLLSLLFSREYCGRSPPVTRS